MHALHTLQDWLDVWLHFASVSLLAVGGPITLIPDLHRFLVLEHQWLTDAQFNASIAIAQAAPGPNMLFISLLGWNLGLNAAGGIAMGASAIAQGLLGVIVTTTGGLLPSTLLAYFASRWAYVNQHLRAVKAFKVGMAPIVTALLLSSGWLLAAANDHPAQDWGIWLVTLVATVLVWRTRIHLLWWIMAGGVLGALLWV